MRNHPTDVKSSASKMKGTVSATGKTIRAPLPLPKQLFQRYVPACKDTKIPVHGKNPLLRLHGQGGPYRNTFLSYPTKPLRNLSLPQQMQHFFLNHPRIKKFGIKIQ